MKTKIIHINIAITIPESDGLFINDSNLKELEVCAMNEFNLCESIADTRATIKSMAFDHKGTMIKKLKTRS